MSNLKNTEYFIKRHNEIKENCGFSSTSINNRAKLILWT